VRVSEREEERENNKRKCIFNVQTQTHNRILNEGFCSVLCVCVSDFAVYLSSRRVFAKSHHRQQQQIPRAMISERRESESFEAHEGSGTSYVCVCPFDIYLIQHDNKKLSPSAGVLLTQIISI